MILILDYESSIRQMLNRLLSEHGYQSLTVDSSEAAVAALRLGGITKVMAHWRLDNDTEVCGQVLIEALGAGLDHADLCVTTNNPKFMDEIERNAPRFKYLLEYITVLYKPYLLQQILDFAAN